MMLSFPAVQAHKEKFCAIAEQYIARANGEATNLILKREHSLRVLENAQELVRALDLSFAPSQTVLLAALYHDIGRFPQLENYGTMDDSRSEDHGKMSVRELLRGNLLQDQDPAARRAVLGAVFLHNKRTVPAGLPQTMDLALRVVRDSDKLDIFQIMLDNLNEAACRDNPTVVLDLEYDETAYTSELAAVVRRGELADYRSMRWVNDFKLLLLAWVYDFNFAASRRLLAQRKMVHAVVELLPRVPELQDIGCKVLADLENSLES